MEIRTVLNFSRQQVCNIFLHFSSYTYVHTYNVMRVYVYVNSP